MNRKKALAFGMTGTQIGILAGLAFAALLSVGGLLWLVLSGMSSPVPADQQPVSGLPSSSAGALSQTPTSPLAAPTATITPPVSATTAPPSGWVEFKTDSAGIWLPASFVGGDMLQQKSATIQKIKNLGKYFQNEAQAMATPSKNIVMWMIDKNKTQSFIITAVLVQHSASTADKTLDQSVKDILNDNSNGTPVASMITVNGIKKMTLLGRETRRLTYQQQMVSNEGIGVVYYIKDGADIWSVGYAMGTYEYAGLSPIIDQSIQTFNLTK